MAKNYQANLLGLVNFLDSIELDRSVAEGESEEKEDGVTLITLHNTKGLEFPKVIITGVENGIFPREDKVGDELEEERRIFYVGITRAKDELYITSCKERRLYGRTEVMMPSKFLIEAGDVFEVFGKQPAAYRYAGKTDTRFENEFELPVGANKISKNTVCADELEDELGGNAGLKAKYSKGTKIYHSDWGYGQIIACEDESGEYVVNVKFETGATKKFMPEYQSSSLEIIKD
jgi:DNA helicase-2/ATP-dependent DNA helicase PcrA